MLKIYGLYDKVANTFVSTTLAENDGLFVRQSFYAIMMDYALNDVDYYCLGEIDQVTGLILPCKPRLCSWDSYKFPVTRLSKEKFLSKEEIIKSALEKKEDHFKEINSKDYLEHYKVLVEKSLERAKNSDSPHKNIYIKHYEKVLKDINNGLKSLDKKEA